jgi:hypothetical protein
LEATKKSKDLKIKKEKKEEVGKDKNSIPSLYFILTQEKHFFYASFSMSQ